MLPDGSPYYMGSTPSPLPFRVYCARCKRASKITAAEWNRLPRLTLSKLDEYELTDVLAKDWTGQGFSEAQARDLLGAGLVASSPEVNRG